MWGKKLVSFECEPLSDVVKVSFSDGTTVISSALIACDGIHSVARRLLWPEVSGRPVSPLSSPPATKGATSGSLQLEPQPQPQPQPLHPPLQYLGLMVILGISPIISRALAPLVNGRCVVLARLHKDTRMGELGFEWIVFPCTLVRELDRDCSTCVDVCLPVHPARRRRPAGSKLSGLTAVHASFPCPMAMACTPCGSCRIPHQRSRLVP
jgi:2-polyprenyl-6-methoxyphenol hydroxylase-like FAD-dependent oxidoreductase